jgi:DNA-binding NtrC family response regulator
MTDSAERTTTLRYTPTPLTDGQESVAQLHLVLHCRAPQDAGIRLLLSGFDEVHIGRGKSRGVTIERQGKARVARVDLPDPHVSSRHVILRKKRGTTWTCEDQRSKNGTFVSGVQAIGEIELDDGALVEVGGFFFLFRVAGAHDARELIADVDLTPILPELATHVATLHSAFEHLRKVATNGDVPVFVLGESGTGKEVVARALHTISQRSGQLVAVNVPAIPEAILGSELFGSKKGAFSGADDREGLVRAADKGTLFLDELGDLPMPAQVALLRVLQEKEVVPLGATKPIKVDVRIVAATHRDVERLVAQGNFRADLLARLAGLTIRLPPLSRRVEDLGLLIRSIVRRMPRPPSNWSLTNRAARALLTYHWPLNVRELERALSAAIALAQGEPIDMQHLPDTLQRLLGRATGGNRAADMIGIDEEPLGDDDAAAKARIEALLTEHSGNISAVAEVLGKARNQIHRWIKRYKIDLDSFRR